MSCCYSIVPLVPSIETVGTIETVGAVDTVGAIGGSLSLGNVLHEVSACHNATLLACIGNHSNDKYHDPDN